MYKSTSGNNGCQGVIRATVETLRCIKAVVLSIDGAHRVLIEEASRVLNDRRYKLNSVMVSND